MAYKIVETESFIHSLDFTFDYINTNELGVELRKFPVKDYFVFYTINDILEEVQFLKIIHSSRNIYEINYFSN